MDLYNRKRYAENIRLPAVSEGLDWLTNYQNQGNSHKTIKEMMEALQLSKQAAHSTYDHWWDARSKQGLGGATTRMGFQPGTLNPNHRSPDMSHVQKTIMNGGG